MAYNQAYGTIRGPVHDHEMSVLGTSSFVMANENTSASTLQNDGHPGYESMDDIRNRDTPSPYTQAVQPEDRASSVIYETIPETHLGNPNDVIDYIQLL